MSCRYGMIRDVTVRYKNNGPVLKYTGTHGGHMNPNICTQTLSDVPN